MEEAYRFCDDLVVLDGGAVIAAGAKRTVFASPGSAAAARLTGCKNIFPVVVSGEGRVEVPQLGVSLAGGEPAGPRPAQVGIRARHLRLWTEDDGRGNLFACRLRELSESPHEMTLGLALGDGTAPGTLAMQMGKEEWRSWEGRPQPWYVELPAERLLWLPG
jgi:molybdate transport system ATP-binding protein